VGILQETQLDRAGMIVTLFKCILKDVLIWLIEKVQRFEISKD
jgi:hypothetical protein